jgi:hypothetical protein
MVVWITDIKETTPSYESDLNLLRQIPRVTVVKKSETHPEPVPFSEEEDPFLYWLAKERSDYVYGLEQCRIRSLTPTLSPSSWPPVVLD